MTAPSSKERSASHGTVPALPAQSHSATQAGVPARSAKADQTGATTARSYLLPIIFDGPGEASHDAWTSHRLGGDAPKTIDTSDVDALRRPTSNPRSVGERLPGNQTAIRRPEPALPDPYVASGEGHVPSQFFTVTMTPRRLLTAREAADYCGITQKQLRTVTGIAPVQLPNGKQLFDIRDLDRFIESCKSPSAGLSDDDILARL